MKQVDMFSGTFDNTATRMREVWQDGRLIRYAGKNCCGDESTSWPILRKPWGAYPDYPHGNQAAA